MLKNHWWKLSKGTGIRVKVNDDFDLNNNQKYRPGIVIKSYPSHVKVQLMSTVPNKHKNITSIKKALFWAIWYNKVVKIKTSSMLFLVMLFLALSLPWKCWGTNGSFVWI